MKSKEFNIKLISLSTEELHEMLDNTQAELKKLKMNHKTAELENPLEIRFAKRNIVINIITEDAQTKNIDKYSPK